MKKEKELLEIEKEMNDLEMEEDFLTSKKSFYEKENIYDNHSNKNEKERGSVIDEQQTTS